MSEEQEFERRTAKVRDAMREKGLETLLVFESGGTIVCHNYVAYLTDFISVGPQTILVLPVDCGGAVHRSRLGYSARQR